MTAIFPISLVAATLPLALLLPLATADVLVSNDVVTGGDAARYLGESAGASVWLKATTGGGDANGCNAGGGPGSSPVTVTLATSPPGILSLSTSTLTMTGCGDTAAEPFDYTVVGGAVGDVVAVSATATGGKSGSTYTNDGFTVTIVPAPNVAPTTPGVPVLSLGSLSPNAGEFTLAWGTSTDDDGDAIQYALERRDSDDADWSGVDGAGALATPSFSFAAANLAPEGTWTFRVSASDGALVSGSSAASLPVVVDLSAPTAPTATPDRAPDFGGWWKDAVTVSFMDGGDATLADGSAGSGVASVTAPQTFTTSGAHAAAGGAMDAVGWASLQTTLDVLVDADAPGVGLSACPIDPVMRNSARSVSFDAWDGQSGVAGPASGVLALDTSALGTFTATKTVSDNVGHEASASCVYSVIGYAFDGFYNPASTDLTSSKTGNGGSTTTSDGTVWNGARGGSTIPLKFEAYLGSDDGGWTEQTMPMAGDAPLVAFQVQRVACPGSDEIVVDYPVLSSGSTSLRYDATAGHFIFNWKTPTTKGCYVLTMTGLDGTQLMERFVLR